MAPYSTHNRKRWYEPKIKIDWSIKQQIKAKEKNHRSKLLHLETVNKYANYNKWYTDGSVKEDQVGCGIKGDNIEIAIQMNKMCTIFSAESRAMLETLNQIQEDGTPNIIFTDSASCLEALEKGESKHPWIANIRTNANKKKVTFCWIPSHVGIKGNEEADKLAEMGRTSRTTVTEVPSHDIIEWYKTRTIWTNDAEWRVNSSSFLRMTKPTTLRWRDQRNAKNQRILTRLRIGHTWLSHGHLLKKEDPPKCRVCNDTLTADHIIRNCPGYSQLRQKYNITGVSIYNNTYTNETALLEFLREAQIINSI